MTNTSIGTAVPWHCCISTGVPTWPCRLFWLSAGQRLLQQELTALDRDVEEGGQWSLLHVCDNRGLDPTQCGIVTFLQRFRGPLNQELHFHVPLLDNVHEYSLRDDSS